jgi:hypothetical protein
LVSGYERAPQAPGAAGFRAQGQKPKRQQCPPRPALTGAAPVPGVRLYRCRLPAMRQENRRPLLLGGAQSMQRVRAMTREQAATLLKRADAGLLTLTERQFLAEHIALAMLRYFVTGKAPELERVPAPPLLEAGR